MTWKDDKNLGSWDFTKQPDKFSINVGNKIATSEDPIWSNEHTGVPITNTHIPCGYWFDEPYVLTENPPPSGLLYGAGRNTNYQLGTEAASQYVTIFGPADSSATFTKVIMGDSGSYMLALSSNGILWGVGSNSYGCLGIGDSVSVETLTPIGLFVDIAASHFYSSSFGIATDGTLWSTGYNNYGQLGIGDQEDVNIFTQVGSAENWVSVDCGSVYTMAINSLGELWACGDAYQGATGLGYGWAYETSLVQVSIPDVGKVSCGYYYTMLLNTDGALYMTGSNQDGQFGLGDRTARNVFTPVGYMGEGIIDICAGKNGNYAYSGVSFVIKRDGTLWAAGSNLYNIMGIEDTSDRLTFIDTGMTDCVKVSSKGYSVLVTKSDGSLWGCGLNSYGELGLGDRVARTAFEQIDSNPWISPYCSYSSMGIRLT